MSMTGDLNLGPLRWLWCLFALWITMSASCSGDSSVCEPVDDTPGESGGMRIILKADDLFHHLRNPDILHPRWVAFFELLKDRGIAASTGLICKCLETGSEAFKESLRELIRNGRIEVWNHGYTHSLEGADSSWQATAEFCGTAFEFQYEHLRIGQQLIRDELGVTSVAFGAPGNATDENTLEAMLHFPEIRLWFRGHRDFPGEVMSVNLRAEDGQNKPNLGVFEESLRLRQEIPVLHMQVHPGSWTEEEHLTTFERILDILQESGARFMTPSEYLLSIGPDRAGVGMR